MKHVISPLENTVPKQVNNAQEYGRTFKQLLEGFHDTSVAPDTDHSPRPIAPNRTLDNYQDDANSIISLIQPMVQVTELQRIRE